MAGVVVRGPVSSVVTCLAAVPLFPAFSSGELGAEELPATACARCCTLLSGSIGAATVCLRPVAGLFSDPDALWVLSA